jgi:hypothetical protein
VKKRCAGREKLGVWEARQSISRHSSTVVLPEPLVPTKTVTGESSMVASTNPRMFFRERVRSTGRMIATASALRKFGRGRS